VDGERRLSFGSVAEQYDRARPSYPAALADDVLGLAPFPRAVEVGAGTGKATELFAVRGAHVLALEPDPEMAAVARRKLAAYDGVELVEREFERWQPPAEPFGLLFSGQAWHWIAPDVRYARARAALAGDGVLAAFWNQPDWERCELREPLEEAYRGVAFTEPQGPMQPRPVATVRSDDWEREIAAADGFGGAELRGYDWSCEYTTAQYLELLGTHSDHIVLPDAQRAALLDAVGAAIDAHGGRFLLPYRARLCLARAC
jgi:SAM-dependent methyltransferase